VRPPRIFLIGPPGAGKTTLGRKWASTLKVPFYDSDEEIVRRTGRSIAAWFEVSESAFRAIEHQIIQALIAETPWGLFAIGGGYPAQPQGISTLRTQGYLIWIDPPMEEVLSRLASTSLEKRPLLYGRSKAEWQRLLESRRSAYRAADLHWVPMPSSEPILLRWMAARLIWEGSPTSSA
jgi:shikimate kinase